VIPEAHLRDNLPAADDEAQDDVRGFDGTVQNVELTTPVCTLDPAPTSSSAPRTSGRIRTSFERYTGYSSGYHKVQALFNDVPKTLNQPTNMKAAMSCLFTSLWKWNMKATMSRLFNSLWKWDMDKQTLELKCMSIWENVSFDSITRMPGTIRTYDIQYSMGTWEQVIFDPNTQMQGTMLTYYIKCNADGSAKKSKARLVIHGDHQFPGVRYLKTFTYTAQLRIFCLVICLAQIPGGTVTHCDISNDFTNGISEEEQFMRNPPDYTVIQGTMLKLNKSLYAFCQASKVWPQTLSKALLGLGFKQSNSCLFYHPDIFCLFSTPVDDLLFLSDAAFRDQAVRDLAKIYILADYGVVPTYLGMNITFSKPGEAAISKKNYIEKMVARFNFSEATTTRQPLRSGAVLTKADSPATLKENLEIHDVPFGGIIESLLHSSLGTRPDTTYAVDALSRYKNNPGPKHWKYANSILLYLKGSATMRLVYKLQGPKKIRIEIFSDYDWGSNTDDTKSISGFNGHVNGIPVSWISRTQISTALYFIVRPTFSFRNNLHGLI
jgi:hypothetical protein